MNFMFHNSGPSEPGGPGRMVISDFGRNRSKAFSFKRPWINSPPTGFSDLPTALQFKMMLPLILGHSFDCELI